MLKTRNNKNNREINEMGRGKQNTEKSTKPNFFLEAFMKLITL